MKANISLGFILAASAALALPSVDPANVTMTQDAGGKMTIGYVLTGEPAVITVDIQTNDGANAWVSIGESNLRGFAGDANRLIQPDGGKVRTATWQPGLHWGGADVTGGNLRAVVNAWPTNNPPDIAVFSLSAASNVMFYTSLAALPYEPTNELYKTEFLVMKRCHAAGLRWNRGAPFGEANRREGNDQHYEDPFVCTISADYYIGLFELTRYQYDQVMTSALYSYDDPVDARKPKCTFSWEHCRGANATYDWPTKGHEVGSASLMGKLRARTGYDFDLPTAAQWEYACRAGTATAFSNGTNDGYHIQDIAWTSENASAPQEVGLLPANPWGFYDMHGNASEWCLDYMCNYPYKYDCENGPDAPPKDHSYMNGAYRIAKGGGFALSGTFARSGGITDWSAPSLNTDHGTQIGCRVSLPAVAR